MKDERLEKFGFLLHDSARLLRRRFEMRGDNMGLSSAQWRLLARLVRNGPCTQARLADLLEIEPISVSRLLDRMETGGWTRREPDPSDKRVRIVFATPKAAQTFASVQGLVTDLYDEALAGLSPAERIMLMQMLETVVENLSSACDAQEGGKVWKTGT